MTEARNAQIRQAARAGVSLTTLAHRYGVSRQRIWQIVHLARAQAQNAVSQARKRGRLQRPDRCEGCQRRGRQLETHHEDYAQRLSVRWLCPPCHRLADAQRSPYRFQVGGAWRHRAMVEAA